MVVTKVEHTMWFGSHPRTAGKRIDVRDGLWLYLDEEGKVHSVHSTSGVIGTRALVEVLGVIPVAIHECRNWSTDGK